MKSVLRGMAVVGVLALVAAACGGNNNNGGGSSGAPSSSGTANFVKGGTLNIVQEGDVSAAYDPAKEYYQVSFEHFKCCLARMLFSTNGLGIDQGGGQLRPDLAASMPTVSSDGLTWTISIKPGIKYAPPFQNVEVTAQDFIRAMMREADPKASAGGYSFYYSAIQGFDDFGAGKASTITGLSAPDDHTLVVKTTAPTGDLGWRLAMPAAIPIPPLKNFPLGAANGHTLDYGRFFVGTGPYMMQGADQMDFNLPASKQKPASGYIPGRQLIMVRNPSWDPATDDLRPAYVDQINITIGGSTADLFNKIQTGDADWVGDAAPPADVLAKYSQDPSLQQYLHVNQQNAVSYLAMNLAVPPFDDIHVRKAVNWAIDKAGGRQLAGGPLTGDNAGHIFPDGLTNNLLKSYDPYATPGDHGSAEKAKAEMALSKYDTNKDGVCDASVCQNILTITSTTDPAPKITELYASDLKAIGITLNIKALSTTTMYAKCNTLPDQVPMCTTVGWIQDYPDPYTFGPPLFGSASLYPACCNYSALGASSSQLSKWGYSVTSVPSADTQLAACAKLPVGDTRTQCWANFDKYLMEQVVPWVPRTFTNEDDIMSKRICNFSFDEFGGTVALDHLALCPGA